MAGDSKTTVSLPIEVIRRLAGLRVEGGAIYLRRYNVRIATFSDNAAQEQAAIAAALDAIYGTESDVR